MIGFSLNNQEPIDQQIELAIKNCDFLEINYNALKFCKSLPSDFAFTGHLSPSIDLSNKKIVLEELEIFDQKGAKLITLHVSDKLSEDQNVLLLSSFAEKYSNIAVENSSYDRYSDLQTIYRMAKKANIGITLDIGHMILAKQQIPQHFMDRVKIIHIHKTFKGHDHLLFESVAEAIDTFKLIQKYYDGYICLETFYTYKNNKIVNPCNWLKYINSNLHIIKSVRTMTGSDASRGRD